MMICKEVKNQVKDFLADSAPEETRVELRDHMRACQNCRGFLLTIDSFANDLKRLGEVTLPFDLASQVSEYLHAKRESRVEARQSWRRIFKTAAAASLLGSLAAAVYFFSPSAKEAPPPLLSPAEAARKSLIKKQMEQLEELEKNLSQFDGGREVTGVILNSAARTVEKLQPFHWHLRFASDETRQDLVTQIKDLSVRVLFERQDFMVISLDQSILGPLVELIRGYREIQIEGNLADVKSLPKSQAPIQVSLSLLSSQLKSPIGSLHWHARFMLGDSYRLLNYLREHKFNLLYESSELLVLELSEEEFEDLAQGVKTIPGFVLEMGKINDRPRPGSDGRILLSLHYQ